LLRIAGRDGRLKPAALDSSMEELIAGRSFKSGQGTLTPDTAKRRLLTQIAGRRDVNHQDAQLPHVA
jgi:hypothetical protein